MKKIGISTLFVISALVLSPVTSHSQTDTAAAQEQDSNNSLSEKKLDRILVTGSQSALTSAPGSAYLLTGENFEEAASSFDDVHRTLRRIPGVTIIEEEGFGLRPNIGIRGAAGERSENITVMEDGILIAPAPYSAPAAYYFPSMGRMEGLEVTKGAGQIKYGPRTTGGALNLLSTSIPDKSALNLKAKAGEHDTLIGHLSAGDSFKHGGVMLETYQAQTDGFKKLDGGGDTGYDVQDYIGKFRINTDKAADFYQELEVKLGAYDQDSNETYVGLSLEDFKKDPYRRYRGTHLDNIAVEHEQIHVRHFGELGSGLDITNTFYVNKTKRNWFKLDKVGEASLSDLLDNPSEFSNEFSWLTGSNSEAGAFAIRNNRREYHSTGFQTVLGNEFETGSLKHNLEISGRFHKDYEDRFQEDDKYTMNSGTLVLDALGAPGTNANRRGSADAWAFYIQDKIALDALTVTPGIRYEKVNFRRLDWGVNDPDRSGVELKQGYNSVDEIIPGVLTHYQINQEVSVFASLHKGFAPPGPTGGSEIKSEESINYETGLGFSKGDFNSKLVLFYNDYENLLGADTASSGGTGSGDLFNAGESKVSGIEAALDYDFAKIMNLGVNLPWYANYTYTDSEFSEDFESTLFGTVLKGDAMPYIAEHQAATGIAVDHDLFRVGLNMFYQEGMPTLAGSAEKRGGPRTDSHVVFDLEAAYKIKDKKAELFVAVENLFDEDYIAALRPAGARPGMPRTFLAGIKVNL